MSGGCGVLVMGVVSGSPYLRNKMAGHVFDFKNYVLYVCSCSQKVAIDDMYFCHHCKSPRCNDCVSTLIDNSCVSCPHCFEAVPQADSRSKKNKCSHCFQCPLCGSTLTSRFVVVANELPDQLAANLDDKSSNKEKTPSPEKRRSIAITTPTSTPPRTGKHSRSSFSGAGMKSPGTKFYYLSCTYCRWSTRDVGINDKRSPLDFKEKTFPGQERFSELLSYYKTLDIVDRTMREQSRKQQSGRKIRSYTSLLDSSKFKNILSPEHRSDGGICSVAEDPQPLPDDFYDSPVSMETTTDVVQRFRDPGHQPAHTNEFWPRPLSLIGKKLHRCRGCDHILLKADVNLNSIRFKINQLALFTVPRIRIMHFPKLVLGDPTILPISFTNPVSHPMKLSFLSYPNAKALKEAIYFPIIPEGEFVLSDSESIDDVMDESNGMEEDNTFVLSREPGKLVLRFGVVAESFDRDTKIAFVLKFTYMATVDTEDGSEHFLEIPVLINCGHTKM